MVQTVYKYTLNDPIGKLSELELPGVSSFMDAKWRDRVTLDTWWRVDTSSGNYVGKFVVVGTGWDIDAVIGDLKYGYLDQLKTLTDFYPDLVWHLFEIR